MRKAVIAIGILLIVVMGVCLYPIVSDTDAHPSSPRSALTEDLTTGISDFVDTRDSIDAVVIANSNDVLFETGPTHAPINTHSVRKSIMDVMVGMAVREGRIDVNDTLADLQIDDALMPLTEAELSAKVSDLLKARSGIYIEASGETDEMKAARPQRGQHPPGSFYYYNNWDFNTLGAILTRTSGRTLQEYLDEMGQRLGWQDYAEDHLLFSSASGSEHDQYIIYMSARDLARIGQMILRGGLDNQGEPLITESWITESFQSYSELTGREPLDAYGYLWSLDQDAGTIWATGWGGQYLLIDQPNDFVIVTRNLTGRRVGEFLWLVALNNSTQGRLTDTAALHAMVLSGVKE